MKDAAARRKEALMASLALVAGFDVDQLKLLRSLKIPAKYWAMIDGLSNWEHELSVVSGALLLARSLGREELEKLVATEIGAIIAARLARRKDEVLSLTCEGIKNLQRSDPFRLFTRRRNMHQRLQVLLAFFFLKGRKQRPTQKKVVNLLEQGSSPLKTGRIAKLFDELGLREHQGDERRRAVPSPNRESSVAELLVLAGSATCLRGLYSEWRTYEPLVAVLDNGGYRTAQAILWMTEK